jgi:hypothetical protein
LWQQHPRPSVFADDVLFKAKQSGKTASQISTEVVKRKRDEGTDLGTIYGLNKERDEALLHARSFHVFSKAGTK